MELSDKVFPLTFANLYTSQQKDKQLLKLLKQGQYCSQSFCGGNKQYDLICHKDKIIVPSQLQTRVTQWYHDYLLHPGQACTEETIKQHLWWPDMRKTIITHIKYCDVCQQLKKTTKKYGHLPPKVAEGVPWECLCQHYWSIHD